MPADRLGGPPQAEVLVLGSYHMGNPGRDIFNLEADDVLAPRRQAEIRELLEVLARFRPSKIAIEADADHPKIKQYQDYLAGKYELGRDERDQIGFRLAKELSLPKIFGIDADGEFPFLAVQNYAKAHEREKELESLMAQVGKSVQDDNEYLKSHSVLQMLLRTNSNEAVRRGLAGYALLAHFGEAYDYAGARLLTEWYRRNMRIHSHLLNVIEPGDRVLVIYGSGHLGLLRQAVQDDPTLTLRTIEEFASAAEKENARTPVSEHAIYYLEIVTEETKSVSEFYADAYGWIFEPEAPELGNALVATLPGGSLCGIRAPMHEQEKPTVRPYLLVPNIDAAVKRAAELGAVIAVEPMDIPGRGKVAIYFLGEIQQGLWQLP